MAKLRCGVVGLGRGRLFVERLSALESCDVVAVCDIDERTFEGLGGVACHTDYARFLDESRLDFVAIVTPGPCHAVQSVRALDRGLHVLTETPCVYSLEEAAAVVAAVRRSGCKYMLTEDYVFAGFVQRWREIIQAGELGDVVGGHGEYTHDCRDIFLVGGEGRYVPWVERAGRSDVQPSWRATDLPPLKYCSHTLGPLLHLMDDRCVSITAVQTGPHCYPEAGTIDLATAVARTEKGAVLSLTNGFGLAHPFAFHLNLYGTAGSIRCVNLGTPDVRLYRDGQETGWESLDCGWYDRPDGRDWLTVMFEAFVGSIIDDTDPPIDVFTSLDYTVPGICAHISAEQDGAPVAVPDFRLEG